MEKNVLMVPTYYGAAQVAPNFFPDNEEYDEPRVPVLIHDAEGVRLVLGARELQDLNKPDIQIERRPNGWAVFLRPVSSGDTGVYVFFLDDGRTFLVPDGHSSEQIEVLEDCEDVPMIDDPPLPPNRFLHCPELSAAWVQAQKALQGESNDDEHDALRALVNALENVDLFVGDSAPYIDATSHIVVPQNKDAK